MALPSMDGPPSPALIARLEEEMNGLYARGDHAAIKKITRALLDREMKADFDIGTGRWSVSQQHTFEELRERILSEREEKSAHERTVERAMKEAERGMLEHSMRPMTATDRQKQLADKERQVRQDLADDLRVIADKDQARHRTERAIREIEEARREAQRGEINWRSPEQQEKARRALEEFRRQQNAAPPHGWPRPKPWRAPDRDEQERDAAQKKKKEEDERLSPPDIDRSLSAVIDGIDIDMRGDSSEDTTEEEAAEPGGEGATDNAGGRATAYAYWDEIEFSGYEDEPYRNARTCDCDEWDCEHYRAWQAERRRGRQPDYG